MKRDSVIFHIDVNSAYLSWTSAENLKKGAGADLRNIPAIIGGNREDRHGIVLAKSTPAKKFGIKTAETIASALKKCPNLVIAPPDHDLYRRYSKALFDLLLKYSPDLEPLSIDECFMDFTSIQDFYESPAAAACKIKDHIYNSLGFTVNIGISTNKVLAKMASDFEKPNKIHTLFPWEIQSKMWPLPIGDLYMVGKSSAATLNKLGIRTIGDLAKTDLSIITSHLKSHGELIWNYANGIDRSVVTRETPDAKGIGNSITLPQDLTTAEDAKKVLLDLTESVSSRLRKSKLLASSVSVEIKYSTFHSVSHQTQLLSATSSTDQLYQISCRLFDELWDSSPIRLLGIRTTKLSADTEPVQLSIFDLPDYKKTAAPRSVSPKEQLSQNEKSKNLDLAIDKIRKKYGVGAITRASLLNDKQR
jgi:nucleotidyltransferase/DNA polymerase involved in DNA repair